eukprot:9601061-Ditylum_brightwellii.AAC.1
MQRAGVPYVAARNCYASSCVTHTPQEKVSHYPNTASTGEFVPAHRWNTIPPVTDTNSVCNLAYSIDFNAPFLPDSTGDTSNKDAFCIITTSTPRIFTYIIPLRYLHT